MKSGDPIVDRLCDKLEEICCEDPAVRNIITRLMERSIAGQAKYKQTLARTDLTDRDWLNHALEESLDLINYLQVLIERPNADTGLQYMQDTAIAIATELEARLKI